VLLASTNPVCPPNEPNTNAAARTSVSCEIIKMK
jgi:hypothetical protein